MTSQWPLLVTRLVALLPTLSGWSGVAVYDGAPDSADPGGTASVVYCAVGYVEDEQGAGRATQEPSGDGFFDGETGEVRCELFSGNGDGDMAAARTAGWALFDALKESIRADRTVGVLPHGSTASVSADVITGKQAGAGQLLVISLTYTTPLT